MVRSQEQSVEVITLSLDEIESIGLSGPGQTASSVTFEGLTVAVDSLFAA